MGLVRKTVVRLTLLLYSVISTFVEDRRSSVKCDTRGKGYGKKNSTDHHPLLSGSQSKHGNTGGRHKLEGKDGAKIGYFEMYRFADKWDVIMLFVAVLAAIGHGFTWSVSFELLADNLESLVDIKKLRNFADSHTALLRAFNMTIEKALKNADKLTPYCSVINRRYGLKLSCAQLPAGVSIFDNLYNQSMIFVYGCMPLMVCATLQAFLLSVTSQRQINRMRVAFFRNVMRQEIKWFDSRSAGELTIKLTDDITKIHEAIGKNGGGVVQWMASSTSAAYFCVSHGWKLALLMQVISPVFLGAFGALGFVLKSMAARESQAYAKAGGVAEEVISSIRTVHAFGGQEKEAVRYTSRLRDATKFSALRTFLTGLSMGITWTIFFFTSGIGIWYGGTLVMQEDYKASDTLMVFFNSWIACVSLTYSFGCLVAINTGRGAAQDVFSIIDRKSQIDSGSTVGLYPAKMSGSITFQSVSFNYPSRRAVQILQKLDLLVKEGQRVAIVGASGQGKSTIMQLLLRFYDPDCGKVCLDGENIRNINVQWLRQHMGVVSQEPVLFPTTIAENIRYGREDATMEQIVQACKDANAYDFITKLPDKLETYVGERGAQLSGGQKQRIAIARALVSDPRILLLDEATSSLDSENEAIVQNVLDKASGGRTTLVIAHRLSTVRSADLIVALDKGRICESGTHDELMSRRGVYFNLVSHQLKTHEYDRIEDNKRNNNVQVNDLTAPCRVATAYGEAKQQEVLLASTSSQQQSMSNRQVLYRLASIISPQWFLLLLACISSLVTGALSTALAVLETMCLDVFTIVDVDQQREGLKNIALLACGMGVISLFTYFSKDYLFGKTGERLALHLGDTLFRSIIRQDISWFDDKNHETGILGTQLAVDPATVLGVVSALGTALLAIGNLGTGLVIAIYCSWRMALLSLFTIPIWAAGGYTLIKLMEGTSKDSSRALEEVCRDAVVCLDNIRTVAALSREEKFTNKLSTYLWAAYRNNRIKVLFASALHGVLEGLTTLSLGVNFYYATYLLQTTNINPLDIFKILACTVLGGMHLGAAVAFVSDASEVLAAARRIFTLQDQVPDIDATSHAGLQPSEGSFTNTIHFVEAKFRYPMRPDVLVLNSLNLTVEPYETLALVGESGAGKSTIAQLLQRFYDLESGGLFLDTYNIKDLNVAWLRSQIGLVSQEPILMDTSIAENIAYGDSSRQVSMKDITEAARTANLHHFIMSLPDKYKTNVGSKGVQLSGGQKQRVAIARALIRNPKILVLDEATSALDTESEKIVQKALDKARQGRTCIIIAHRLSTVKDADKIAVLKGGVIREMGTHDQLMSKQGLYYNLHMSQS